MKANRCPGCHADTKRKLLKKERPLTEEEEEALGEVTVYPEEY